MASIRLNEQHRRIIRKKLLAGAFDKREAKRNAALHQLALDIYKDVLKDELPRIKRAPKHWFDHINGICVQIAGRYKHLEFPKGVTLPVTAERNNSTFAAFDARHPFAGRMIELDREEEAIGEERRQLTAEIDAALYSTSTANKLAEAWPEIKPLLESIVQSPVSNLPVVSLDKLNQKLGLVAA